MEIASTILTGVNTIRDWQQHKEKEELEWKQHNESIKLSQEQHEEEQMLAKQIYLVDKFSEIEQHFQQLNADLLASAKESERDMWDQRNQQFSNIVVATTIVITGLITVLVQGILPIGTPEPVKQAYAFSNAISMGLLFICAVLCLEVIWRASDFMYKKTSNYSEHLKKAIKKTTKMMERIRYKKAFDDVTRQAPEMWTERQRNIERNILDMSPEAINEEFTKHQEEVQRYLVARQRIIDKASQAVYSDTESEGEMSFSHFWDTSCKYYSNVAILVFYAGSASLILATMLCMWSYYSVQFQCAVAANISLVLMSLAMVVCLAAVVYMRVFDREYHEFRRSFERRDQMEDAATHPHHASLEIPIR